MCHRCGPGGVYIPSSRHARSKKLKETLCPHASRISLSASQRGRALNRGQHKAAQGFRFLSSVTKRARAESDTYQLGHQALGTRNAPCKPTRISTGSSRIHNDTSRVGRCTQPCRAGCRISVCGAVRRPSWSRPRQTPARKRRSSWKNSGCDGTTKTATTCRLRTAPSTS